MQSSKYERNYTIVFMIYRTLCLPLCHSRTRFCVINRDRNTFHRKLTVFSHVISYLFIEILFLAISCLCRFFSHLLMMQNLFIIWNSSFLYHTLTLNLKVKYNKRLAWSVTPSTLSLKFDQGGIKTSTRHNQCFLIFVAGMDLGIFSQKVSCLFNGVVSFGFLLLTWYTITHRSAVVLVYCVLAHLLVLLLRSSRATQVINMTPCRTIKTMISFWDKSALFAYQ